MKFRRIKKRYRLIKLKLNWSVFYPLKHKLYWFLINNLQWWPLELTRKNKALNPIGKKRIAYYLWEYPALSQTFIQREINALRNSLGEVLIFSDQTSNDFLDECLNQKPICLLPIDQEKLQLYKRYLFKRKLLTYINLFLYTLFRNYHPYKSYVFDKNTFKMAIYLSGLANENKINHIHSPWADRCAFVALIASRLSGISYSIQARAHDVHRKDYLYGLREKFENADFAVTNTQYNFEHIKSELIPSINGKLNLIYNGINLEKFIPEQKRKESDIITLLCVARLIEQKGIIFLLQACKKLKDKGYNFICQIIGGTESLYMNYYLEIKKLHNQLKLEDKVFFLESLPFSEVLNYYNKADIFVLPCVIAKDSSRDITPNALIEAMAMKLPVISTNVTGIPEIVDNGINGILIPPNNTEAIVEAIERLINNPQLGKKLGENARKKIEERFDIRKNINKYVYLFENRMRN